jgi:hypothetical protein
VSAAITKERDDTAVAGGGVDRQHQRREAGACIE